MATLPTICLSALRAFFPRTSAAPSSVSTTAQPLSSGASSSVEYMERDYEFEGLQRFGRASLVAIAAASLCYSAPDLAHAFRGGGPYRQEVTQGQDLTGRDFSGLTLIKQDFKTVSPYCGRPTSKGQRCWAPASATRT